MGKLAKITSLLLACVLGLFVFFSKNIITFAFSPGVTSRVSISSDMAQATGDSFWPNINSDGRFVVFYSFAPDLVSGDSNGSADVFVHDRQTGDTTRVSVASDGTQGNNGSYRSDISEDGQFVAFDSDASNLVLGDTNNYQDVFVHDFQTGETIRASVSSDGTQGNDISRDPAISYDGRFIAFESLASNLVPGDSNSTWDVFVHDLLIGETNRVSVASDGSQGVGFSFPASEHVDISSDGRFVAFHSNAINLVDGDTNGWWDVFVHDRLTSQTTRVSVSSVGEQGNFRSQHPAISPDGRHVAFDSQASNLISDDTNNAEDIFIHDTQTGQTTRSSVSTDGTQGNGDSGYPSISSEGRYVAFESSATNFVSSDTNVTRDVFIHDLQTGETFRVSVSSDGTQGDATSLKPIISGVGHQVVFYSEATTLVSGDTNNARDVYVHELLINSPPTVYAGGPYEVDEGETVQVTATGNDPENGPLTYDWDLDNNGSFETPGQSVPFSAATLNPGLYTIAVKVTDDGSLTATDQATVTVNDIPTSDDFVILGEEGVWIRQNAIVFSGDVGTNLVGTGPFLDSGVETSIGNGVLITDSESDVYGDSIHLKDNSQVQDVFYNDLSGLGTVLGSQNTPLNLPVVPAFPTVPVFSPGTTNVEVPQNGNQTLTAGDYGDLVVRLGATVTFTGGVYNFNSWDIRDNANIYFDAPTEIRIANKLDTRLGVEVRPAPSASIDASDILIYVTGINGSTGNLGATPKAAEFGIQNILEANVYANNGTLSLKQNTFATGAFIGRWVIAGISGEFTYDSAF